MSLNAEFVGLLVSCTGSGFEKATAYPIRAGVLITAYHAIPAIETYNERQDDSSYLLWDKLEGKKYVTNILYYCKASDIAVIECETPPNLDAVILSKNTPKSTDHWDSFGFAKSAVNPDTDKAELESAAGQYLGRPEGKEVQQLRTIDRTNDEKFWRGMSGAPIFTVGTSMLTGVFIETSLLYETDQGPKTIFDGRLRAASIAHLLDCDKFVKAARGEKCSDYLQIHERKLRDFLGDNAALAAKLPSCDEILSELKISPIACIQRLKKDCKKLTNDQDKSQIQSLFGLVLSQIDVPCTPQEGKHLHELDVSTRLLAELAVAKMYNVEPKFADSERLIGRHVLPSSQTELGFDSPPFSEEQARVIAYFLYKRWGNESMSKTALEANPRRYDSANTIIRLQREDDDAVYRFEIDGLSLQGENHPLFDKEVHRHFHTLLPDFPVVLYGKDTSTASIFKDEDDLEAYVRSFIQQVILS